MKKYLFTCLILFFIAKINAQENSLLLGGIYINLGMAKNDLIERINSKHYIILDEGWSLSIKQNIKGEAGNTVGSVGLEKNKVVWIQKNWGSFYNDAPNSMEKVYALLNKRLKEGVSQFNVELSENIEPDFTMKVIYFRNHNHTIRIHIFPTNVFIAEVIEVQE